MTALNRKQALQWYCEGISLTTIAQHYDITVNELKSVLHNYQSVIPAE